MKRRTFMKKSTAAAIIAATPMALTGLVNAEGGGGTGSDSSATWWPGSGGTTEQETTYFTTLPQTTPFPYEGPTCTPTDMQEYQSLDDTGNQICWRLGQGHDPNRSYGEQNFECAFGVDPCPQIHSGSTSAEIARAQQCMNLPYGWNKPAAHCSYFGEV